MASFATRPFMVMEVDSTAGGDELVEDSTVTSIVEDTLVKPLLSTSATNVRAIGGSGAWASGYDGSSYAVAIIDTGVMSTRAVFAGKVSASSFRRVAALARCACCSGDNLAAAAREGMPALERPMSRGETDWGAFLARRA